MTLDKAQKGKNPYSNCRSEVEDQIIRLGIYEGKVTCAGKIGGGPIVIKNRLQEIAIGQGLAEKYS